MGTTGETLRSTIDQLPNLCRQYFWHTHLLRYSMLCKICSWIRYKECFRWHK